MCREHRVVMVVFSFYPGDPRVRREAEALCRNGAHVTVVCLRGPREPRYETVHGVCVRRVPVRQTRANRFSYVGEYSAFFFFATLATVKVFLTEGCDAVHAHNMPDFLVFCGLIPVLFGATAVLDLHDPMPEVFMTKYRIPATHKTVRFLQRIEQICISFADSAITPNEAFKRVFISRGAPHDKISIVMNTPQEDVFRRSSGADENSQSGLWTIMFHGSILERHGLIDALEAVQMALEKHSDIRMKVFGEGDYVDEFLAARSEMGLEEHVHFHGLVSLERIAAEIQGASVGLIPNRLSPFTDLNLPTRIFEYLSMGVPAIAPRTHGILDYFREDNLLMFEPGSPKDLCRAILSVRENSDLATAMVEAGREVYQRHTWDIEQRKLVQIHEGLDRCGRRGRRRGSCR